MGGWAGDKVSCVLGKVSVNKRKKERDQDLKCVCVSEDTPTYSTHAVPLCLCVRREADIIANNFSYAMVCSSFF